MKFLLDVNVGTTIAEALTEAGHEVMRVGLLTPREQDDLARNELLLGHMVVIGPVETRTRPFPGSETND